MSSQPTTHSEISKRSTEFRIVFLFFALLWAYLIIRAFTVFWIHDEIVTKWAYVIHWFPFPVEGNITASNHLMTSLLAGAFTRIFQSDAVFFMRLGSLLAFPIYFWSAYRLKFLFQQKWNFYGFLVALTTTAFLIEFFALARGYGLALAFLVFSLQQMIAYFHSNSKKALIGGLIGWILAIYSSLTLLPFALFGVLFLGLFTLRKKFYFWSIPVLLALIPLGYFINFSFALKELGEFYYGGTEGFFTVTVHSLTFYLWSVKSVWLDVVLCLLTGFMLFITLKSYWKSKNLFDPKMIFSLFFFTAIASILAQRWILDVNFPEDRTAIYLIVFFFGSLFFSIDQFTQKKVVGIVSVVISLLFFAFSFNFTHSLAFYEEHLDEELITLIPESVNGTPTTTAGRWNMENEMTRQLDLPFRAYQGCDQPSDTLVDYMIYYPARKNAIAEHYKVIHQDHISGLALFERKTFLPRSKKMEVTQSILDRTEYQNLHISPLTKPMVLRCSGKLEKMTKEKEIFIVFSSEDSITKQAYTYESIPMIRNTKLNDKGELTFDFSIAMNALEGANSFAVYIWNQNSEELHGKIKLEVYEIED